MDLQLKNHISSYLTDTFIEAIEKFEDIIQKTQEDVERLSKSQYLNVFMGNPDQLVIKEPEFLSSGLNKNAAVKLTVLRVVSSKFCTFILAISDFPVLQIQEIFCIIIQTSDFEGPYFQPWKKGLGPMTTLLIKEPFVQTEVQCDDLQIIRVPIENAQIKRTSRHLSDFRQIKAIGNQCFKNNDFLNALSFYEYALACCNKNSDYNDRAILYTNSAASLYKLSLYDDCLKYCDIATKIDKNYYKSYAWKVHSLLQKKHFAEIPNLLVILQSKALPEDFSKINHKYSVYLSNSLGMYNWKSVAQQAKKADAILGDYFSKYISIRVQQQQHVYYALENVKKNSILIISKALVYDKKGLNNLNSIYKKIIKCFQLQKTSFNCSFKDLLISSGTKETLKQGIKLQYKQIQNRIKRYLIRPKDIVGASEPQTLGIWPQLIKFTHSCNPNCSIVHFESVMLVSASVNINRGDVLTIDFASDIPPLKRKNYLIQKYKIYCKCTICEWKSWPDFSNKDQVSKVTDSLTNITMIKQVFWQLLSTGYTNQQQNLLQKSTKLVIRQISWNDIVMGVRLIRQNQNKSSQILLQIITAGLREFLKIPHQLALEIIDVII